MAWVQAYKVVIDNMIADIRWSEHGIWVKICIICILGCAHVQNKDSTTYPNKLYFYGFVDINFTIKQTTTLLWSLLGFWGYEIDFCLMRVSKASGWVDFIATWLFIFIIINIVRSYL